MSDNDLSTILNQPVIKRSVRIAGHHTSVSLEKPFWDLLKKAADEQGQSLNQIITDIDEARSINLSSAIRLFVLNDMGNNK